MAVSGRHFLHDVELGHALPALPSDRRALRHEDRIAGMCRQHAAVGAGEAHAAVTGDALFVPQGAPIGWESSDRVAKYYVCQTVQA